MLSVWVLSRRGLAVLREAGGDQRGRELLALHLEVGQHSEVSLA